MPGLRVKTRRTVYRHAEWMKVGQEHEIQNGHHLGTDFEDAAQQDQYVTARLAAYEPSLWQQHVLGVPKEQFQDDVWNLKRVIFGTVW